MNQTSSHLTHRTHIVTQTFPPRLGGMEFVMHSLASQFVLSGCETHLHLERPYGGSEGFVEHVANAPKFMRPSVKRRIVKAHSSENDLFICDSWKSVAALPEHAEKVVVLAHGQEYFNKGKHQKRIQAALNRAQYIVSSSAYTLSLIRDSWNIHHCKSTVIHPTYSLSDELGITIPASATEPLRMVTVSRIEARKGLLQVIECLATHKEKLPHYRWEIGGSGPQLDELRQKVSIGGLSEQIHFRGRVTEEEKQRMLSQADIFVMPSYQEGDSLEGFGISYVEAARFGVPAIAGLAGGAKEAVLHLETGWCIDVTDKDALELTIKEALSNKILREKLGKAAQSRYQKELSGSKAFKAFRAFINA